jgi:hypothetical protein
MVNPPLSGPDPEKHALGLDPGRGAGLFEENQAQTTIESDHASRAACRHNPQQQP